jgi:acetoin utilization protein AcuB
MTPGPLTIAGNRSLAFARQMMLEHQVRHLPVLAGGHIAGLLSERDLLLVTGLPGVDANGTRVEEAMVQDVFTVAPDAPVAEVIETMIERKFGSAVVVEGEHVVGVFTTVDALTALHRVLEPQGDDDV